jgi:pyruvate-formate lyase
VVSTWGLDNLHRRPRFYCSQCHPYLGDEIFLAGPSKRTKAVWEKLQPYFQDERRKGVLAVDAHTPSTLLAHKAGYIDNENEVIFGLQTDQPFKRAIFSFGGLRMVEAGGSGSRTNVDRVLTITPPVAAFVAAGFEHSIANIYFISIGLFIKLGVPDSFWNTVGKRPRIFRI